MIGMDWLGATAQMAGLIVAVSAALVILIGRARKLLAPVQSFFKRADAANEILVGRPAIVHPDTGMELAPATLGLGHRLSDIESGQRELKDAVVSLAQVHQDVTDLRKDVSALTTRVDAHIAKHDAPQPSVTVVQNPGGTDTH